MRVYYNLCIFIAVRAYVAYVVIYPVRPLRQLEDRMIYSTRYDVGNGSSTRDVGPLPRGGGRVHRPTDDQGGG